MPLLLIPLVSLLSALFLLDFQNRNTSAGSSKYVSLVSASVSLIIVLIVSFSSRFPIPFEYRLSPLFNLPGMPETLSFSLLADAVSIRWLTIMTSFSFLICLLCFFSGATQKPVHYASHHMAQAGLAFFFLSGSIITGAIGWGITLSAVLLAATDTDRAPANEESSSFTTLMISVFLFMAASFLLYALTGRLSYSIHPDSLNLITTNLIGAPPNPAVVHALSLASLFLLFAVIPGLGLIPFSSWLSDTRDMNALNALFIYVSVIPAGGIILERYQWLFAFTPVAEYVAMTVAILSIGTAFIAIFSQKGTRLTMLWLAVTCSGLLLGTAFMRESLPVSTLLVILYPGLFVFGVGRVLEFRFRIRFGRSIQAFGIVLPFLSAAVQAAREPAAYSMMTFGIALLIYGIPAFHIFRSSGSTATDEVAFSSALGWSAYRFFGTQKLVHYGIVWPVQQIADGFLVLESGWNFFWTHTLSRVLCYWGRLLWLFDRSFIDGGRRRLKTGRNNTLL
jgi:hypothetical protein